MAARAKKSATDEILAKLRAFGLAYPDAHLKSPWPGHKDLAVRDKTFAYLSIEGDPFKISCKLPHSSVAALSLSFCTPTAYGLGKSGWVTAVFSDGDVIPVDMLQEWIDESYRAQAPKKLVAQISPSPTQPPKAAQVEKPARAKETPRATGAPLAKKTTLVKKTPLAKKTPQAEEPTQAEKTPRAKRTAQAKKPAAKKKARTGG